VAARQIGHASETCASRRRSAEAASSSNRSVTPLIAETITTGGSPELSFAALMMPMTRVIASTSATDVPPNFMTIGPVRGTSADRSVAGC